MTFAIYSSPRPSRKGVLQGTLPGTFRDLAFVEVSPSGIYFGPQKSQEKRWAIAKHAKLGHRAPGLFFLPGSFRDPSGIF